MTRKTMDCRLTPSERNCSLVISGEEDEVLEAAAAHAVSAHGHTEGPELREGLRGELREDDELHVGAGSFVQTVEYRTADVDRVRALAERLRERIGHEGTAQWVMATADRDRPGTYVNVIGFPDFDAAMRNSEHEATTDFSKDMQELTEGEPVFRNLDVREVLSM